MKRTTPAVVLVGQVVALLLFSGAVSAQTTKVSGLITGRNGSTMTVQTASEPKLVVVLTDDTQVAQIQGVLRARRKQMSMAALIPGLQVQVEGSYDAQSQLVAKSIRFKGNDLEDAQTIQAGLQPAKEQIEQRQRESEQQKAALERQQQALEAQQAKIGANKDAIQVKGYASAVGSASLNQKLSEDRANTVTQFLQQQGHIPLTNMLAPGAMGESRQVGGDNTAEGQEKEQTSRGESTPEQGNRWYIVIRPDGRVTLEPRGRAHWTFHGLHFLILHCC
jgi:outer membrane protein OmpA-like peptidoglycan-associated protein